MFNVMKSKHGWVITHKESGKSMGVNFEAVPEDSSLDYVLGYAKCLGYMEHWY